MNPRRSCFALIAALAVIEQGIAMADIAPYFESATAQKPRTRAGISLDADGMIFKADLSLQAPGHSTQLVPRVSSSVALTQRLGLETKVELPDWNAQAEPAGFKVDTRVHFDPSAPFVDQLEGRFWRLPDGQTGQIIQFGFHKRLRASGEAAPLTLRSHATYETTTSANNSASGATVPNTRLGFETELTGILPSLPPGHSVVRIKVEKVAGARPATTRSIAYSQNWTMREFGLIGVNLKMLSDSISTANELLPSIGLSWNTQF